MADEMFVDQNEVEGTASGVWNRLLAGNRRFAEGKPVHPNRSAEAREAVIDAHEPDAAILSCSDARVSPDIIFDAGIGDLFTVRTAGHIVDDAVLASLEYAVSSLGNILGALISGFIAKESVAPTSPRRELRPNAIENEPPSSNDEKLKVDVKSNKVATPYSFKLNALVFVVIFSLSDSLLNKIFPFSTPTLPLTETSPLLILVASIVVEDTMYDFDEPASAPYRAHGIQNAAAHAARTVAAIKNLDFFTLPNPSNFRLF